MFGARKLLASLAIVTFALSVTLAPYAHAARQVTWNDLLPASKPLKDPFSALTPDQRFDIETIAWVRSLSEEERQFAQNQQSIEDAEKYERQFKGAGLNVDQLLRDYEKWDAEHRRRQKMVNDGLNGTPVRLAGYLLPLNFSEEGNTDFLLVPYVGACIHVPPPPPNQIVFVKLAKKMLVKDLYTAVWVQGPLLTRASSRALNFIDGTSDISVGYHIDQASVEVYKEE